MVAVVVLLLAGCGGGNKGQQARTAGQVLDDLLRGFSKSSMDDVARGQAGTLDDAFRANSDAVDDAFRVASFDTAVQQSRSTADAAVQSHVDNVFTAFDDVAQRKVENKLRNMVCEARLLAYGEEGNVELFRPWIEQEFAEIGVQLNAGLRQVADWLTEKVNDRTDTYSLACMVWVRSTR